MKLVSIQVGLPRTVKAGDKEVTTGIFKDPVEGPVLVRKLNLDGDRQADLKVHGGVDKAVYAYACDAYGGWRNLRPQDELPWGAMGENLSFETLSEDQICVGDTFELGEAVLQAVQPRFPCYKLAVKFNDPAILKQFMTYNRPGVYFRVLKEGLIDRGQRLKLVNREAILVSVQELFEFKQSLRLTRERIAEILKVQALNSDWRAKFEAALQAP
jgi:MOSC domain-containing protein YiiM